MGKNYLWQKKTREKMKKNHKAIDHRLFLD